MQLLPGFNDGQSPADLVKKAKPGEIQTGLFGEKASSDPKKGEQLPFFPFFKPKAVSVPTISRQDPEIAAARKKQRGIELRRKGRRASILTSSRGVTERTPVNRPQAKAELLGQVGG